jgi:hypothetical protein
VTLGVWSPNEILGLRKVEMIEWYILVGPT